MLAYLDPPYPETENLYREGEGFDHIQLHAVLSDRPLWILSYQDMPVVRELYRGYPMLALSRTGSFRKDGVCKRQAELLIYSHAVAELLPPSPVQGMLF